MLSQAAQRKESLEIKYKNILQALVFSLGLGKKSMPRLFIILHLNYTDLKLKCV